MSDMDVVRVIRTTDGTYEVGYDGEIPFIRRGSPHPTASHALADGEWQQLKDTRQYFTSYVIRLADGRDVFTSRVLEDSDLLEEEE